MFDATLQIIHSSAIADEDAGAVFLQLVLGMAVPVPNAEGNMVPQYIPAGSFRVPLGREAAIATGQEIVEEANKLPEPKPPSKIIIPSGPDEVDATAKVTEGVKG